MRTAPPGRPVARAPRAAALLVMMVSAVAAVGCTRKAPPAPVISGAGLLPRPGSVAPPNAQQQPVAGSHPDRITVAPGETLYGVARRYDVPTRSLIEANDLRPPFRLVAGRQLVLPQVRQYMVQPGDTLYSISRRFAVDASTLARRNEIAPPFPVRVGQVLVLPDSVQTSAAPAVAAAAPPAAPTAAAARDPAVTAEPLPPPANPAEAPRAAPPAPTAPIVEPPPAAAAPPKPAAAASPVPAAAPPTAAAAPPTRSAALEPPPAAPPPPEPRTGTGFQWPVRGTILLAYGPGANGTHNDGINIGAAQGTPVAAANDGVVAYAGNELRGFGNLVLLKHADGWTTAYAHCDSLLVKRGDHVKRGQAIARLGATGAVGEPQLHFELRRGTRALDPLAYLPPAATAAAQ